MSLWVVPPIGKEDGYIKEYYDTRRKMLDINIHRGNKRTKQKYGIGLPSGSVNKNKNSKYV